MAEQELGTSSTHNGPPRHRRRREGEDLLRQGLSPKEVADRLGVDYATVWQWRRRLGLRRVETRRHPGYGEALRLLDSGTAPAEVAARIGVSPYTVYRWRQTRPGPRPGRNTLPTPRPEGEHRSADNDRQRAEEQLRMGHSTLDVATALSLNIHTVKSWRRKLGLPPPAKLRHLQAESLLRQGHTPRDVTAEADVPVRLARRLGRTLHRGPRRGKKKLD
jgi:transposase